MFQVSDLVLINKIDTLEYFDFDFELAKERILKLNPNAVVLPVSAKTGEGLEQVIDWIMKERRKAISKFSLDFSEENAIIILVSALADAREGVVSKWS